MSSQPAKAPKRVLERRRRRYPRYRSEFPVTLTLFCGREHTRIHAHCRDLSQAGIGLLIAGDLALGEVVSIDFSLPSQTENWNLRAVLRCRRGYHYGFEFLSLPAQQSKQLADYVAGLERADSDLDPLSSRDKRKPAQVT